MLKILVFLIALVCMNFSVLGQNPIPEILKRMESHQKSLKTLQADIKINKSTESQAKEGIVRFISETDGYLLRIDTVKSEPESFSLINNQYLLYLKSPSPIYLSNAETAYTGRATDLQKNLFMFFSIPSKSELKKNYFLTYSGQENVNGTIPTWYIELKPKTTKSYKIIALWVNANGMIIQSKVIENNGDWTIILLSNIRKNIALKITDFKIDLPRGIKLIKN